LNRIDHVERQKQQTDTSEIKHNSVNFEGRNAARGRERLRRQLQNGQRENPIQRKQNPDSNQPGPEFVPAEVSVPGFFGGKAGGAWRFLQPPTFGAYPEIPPSKRRQWQRSKRKLSLDAPGVRTKVEARFEHEEDSEHQRDQKHHFSWPNTDT